MKIYDVTIKETYENVVIVDAESRDEAEEIACEMWNEKTTKIKSRQLKELEIMAKENTKLEIETSETMDVLLVKPGEYPEKINIGIGLKSLQKAVDGDIEVVYPYREDVAIICNEERKIRGLPLNRDVMNDDGNRVDIIAGNFLIVGLTEESFGSLTDEQMKRFEAKFHQPETFVRMGKDILTIPIPDENICSKTEPHKQTQNQSR